MSHQSRPRHDTGAGPVLRRDPDGAARLAPSWESLVERLIREAQEQGRFDDLPGHGQPLAVADTSAAGDLALAYHVLHDAGMAPPWIEADKEVRALEADIERLIEKVVPLASPGAEARLGRRLEELCVQHDHAVHRLASLAPSSRLHRRRLDRQGLQDRLVAALRRG